MHLTEVVSMNVRRALPLGLALLAPALLTSRPALAQQSQEKKPGVIYGNDDRQDLWQVTDPNLKRLAASTLGLFEGASVSMSPDGKTAKLSLGSYAQQYDLCPDERFHDQMTGAFCSASLVAPDVVMSAGHCVTSEDNCKTIKFVFGFDVDKQGGASPDAVPASDVYSCAHLIGRQQDNQGADWSLVKLDRPVTDRAVLRINRDGPPAKGTGLVLIGHPAGLPTKVAAGAVVRDPSPNGYFVANTDSYGGNSGSPVFNAATGLIEGVLVRGEQDYEYDSARQCYKSKVCASDGCRGEDVTVAKFPAASIPPQGAAAELASPGPTLRSLRGLAGVSAR
ncbi:MAG: trypsin-like peptidase domain-containing protein [Elusimicrobia bacterium]|nr:trypsin-like peptidase domain-containing protein [Elusimicrobiota bacterium]